MKNELRMNILIFSIIVFWFFWVEKLIFPSVWLSETNCIVYGLVPISLLISGVLAKLSINKWISSDINKVVVLFLFSSILILILVVTTSIFAGNILPNIKIYDKYFILVDFDILITLAVVLAFFALGYRLVNKLVDSKLSGILGEIHFWLMTIGTLIIIGPLKYLGRTKMSRYATNIEFSSAYTINLNLIANILMTIFAIIVFFAQVVFLFNLGYHLINSKKETS